MILKDNLNVYLKKGPYGFYIQLGEDNGRPKPKRVGIPKKMNVEEINFDNAPGAPAPEKSRSNAYTGKTIW